MVLILGCPRAAPAPPDDLAVIWLGGDVQLGAGSARALEPVARLFAGAPGVINLEGPVSDADGGVFNAPRAIAGLKSLGIAVGGICNNHAFDLGPEGFARTRRSLEDARIGTAFPEHPAWVSKPGFEVVVTAHDLTSGVPAGLLGELQKARARGQRMISTFHVTGPPLYSPTVELIDAVEKALAAGADVVVAHGTHALARVERRGEQVVAYGLGNLAFACDCTQEEDGLALRVEFGPRSVRAAAVPLRAGLGGRPAVPAPDAPEVFDLLESIGSPHLARDGGFGWF